VDRRIAQLLDRPKLARAGVKAYSNARYAALKFRRSVNATPTDFDDGLPKPPDRLLYLVSGSLNWDWYIKSGFSDADEIRSAINRAGTDLSALGPVLDFGCGSGRIIRHFAGDAKEVRLYGVDYNRQLVDWCRTKLPFATFSTNVAQPPLDFPAAMFGLVYAYSVFTHLPEDAQIAWRNEMARILRPGGYLWLTVLNGTDANMEKLTPGERADYENGELVIRFAGAAGDNLCTAFPPDAYVDRFFKSDDNWRVIERVQSGPAWGPGVQDHLLVQRL
jgi:SAM-dependent methyltransferase